MPRMAPPFSKDCHLAMMLAVADQPSKPHLYHFIQNLAYAARMPPSNLDPLELHIHVLMLPSWLDIALLKSCYSPMAEDGNDFLGCDETLMNFRLK